MSTSSKAVPYLSNPSFFQHMGQQDMCKKPSYKIFETTSSICPIYLFPAYGTARELSMRGLLEDGAGKKGGQHFVLCKLEIQKLI